MTKQVLSWQKVEEAVAKVVVNAVWNKSQDIRECIKIGTLAKSTEDVVENAIITPPISKQANYAHFYTSLNFEDSGPECFLFYSRI